MTPLVPYVPMQSAVDVADWATRIPGISGHVPADRWLCAGCDTGWPCPPARVAISDYYGDDRIPLAVQMYVAMEAALRGLWGQVTVGELHDRFVSWTGRRQR